jgi:S1-C subfamily serine protease
MILVMAKESRFLTRNRRAVVAFVAGIAIAGGGAYAVTSNSPKISACVDNRTKVMYLTEKTKCPVGRTLVSWNVAGPAGPAGAPGKDGATQDNSGNLSVKDIAKRVLPTVVSISVTSTSGDGTGSGSVIQSDSSKSFIVTNNHVIDDAVGGGKVTVELQDGTEIDATIKGRDIAYDIAVLQVNRGNLPTIEIGDSSKVIIGDLSIAFGSPLGLSGTVTSGIVSSLNRPVIAGSASRASYIDAIQTDAAINPGNSGGPLVDGQGRIIGVNSAIASTGSNAGNIGLGFSIPINQAMRVINEIIATGKSTRPLLGVEFDPDYNGNGKIFRLVPSGAAEKAGIPVNSIIKSIDGFIIKSDIDAVVRIRSNAPGSTVSITVQLPTGGTKTFSVTLGSAPANQ